MRENTGKIRTRITPKTDTFYSVRFTKNGECSRYYKNYWYPFAKKLTELSDRNFLKTIPREKFRLVCCSYFDENLMRLSCLILKLFTIDFTRSKEIEKENIIFFWKSGLPNRLESDIIDSSEFLLSDISWDIGQTRDSSFREKHRHRCNFYWITSVGKKHRNDTDVYM